MKPTNHFIVGPQCLGLVVRIVFSSCGTPRGLITCQRPRFGAVGRGVLGLLAAGLILSHGGVARAAEAVAVGIIHPFIEVTLSAPVPGLVTGRKVKEGDRVRQGDLLLELDNNLERLEVERRRIVRDQKREIYEGTKKLFGTTKGVSKEELDQNEAEFRVAEVELGMAEEQLRRRQIITPHSGEITEILIEVGEACSSYQPLIRVVDTRQCYLMVNLEAAEQSRFKLGQRVMLEVDLGDGKAQVAGKVDFLSPVVDPASGLSVMKVLFDNQDGRIRPGLSGVVLTQTEG